MILTSTSYLVERLTAAVVIDHYTAANFEPALSSSTKRIGARRSPARSSTSIGCRELGWTTDIAGAVTPKASEETGLAAGTPVIVGTVDAAAEAVSVGVVGPGDMMLMYGSTIFIIMLTDERVRDARLWYAPWLFDGQHASMSGLATSGTLTHWFHDQLARELDAETALPTLAAEAEASPPGANGLVLLPYFSGRTHADP